MQFGFNLITYISANVGVGVIARQLATLLIKLGYPLAILDMDPGLGRRGSDDTFSDYIVAKGEDLPYSINLILIFTPSLPPFFLDPPSGVLKRGRLNAGIIFWELPVLPPIWVRALEVFDVVIAPSEFVRGILDLHLSDVRIISAPHAVYTPPSSGMPSIRKDLPDGAILFGTSFEPHSDPQRKNPFGVIDAFKLAFPRPESAHLFIKLNNAGIEGDVSPRKVIADLQARCQAHASIHLLTNPMTYSEVIGFYDECDVFVSLHRAEGLALGPMEAMSLGKPVIATGWSGNMTYMDHTNACLVGYRLINVEGQAPVYQQKSFGKPTVWADPNVREAAAWMKKLVDDPGLRTSIGAKAAEQMRSYRAQAERARFVDELSAINDQLRFLGAASPPKFENLGRLRRAQFDVAASTTQRAIRRAKDLVDRHIAWRWRNRHA